MAEQYLIGLDAGGGTGRCLLVNVETGDTTVAARPWSHPAAPGGGAWGRDFDTTAAWTALAGATREALQVARVNPSQIAGIAVASMRHGTVVLDAEGREWFAAPNRDARAVGEALELAAERGAELYARTGHWSLPIFPAARLRWLANHQPDTFPRAAHVLSIGDWIAYKLCGEIATDSSHAAETMLFDVQKRDWAWDVIEAMRFPRRLFPTIRPAGTKLGTLSESAAQALGLAPGIPVAVGGADTQCALLALGAIRPGDLAAIAGTTAPLQRVLDEPRVDPDRRLWTGLHVVPGLWVQESNAGAMGEALEWFAVLLYPDSPRPVARLLAEAGKAGAGADGLLSTFGTQVFNASAAALPVGNLTLTQYVAREGAARRPHLARAVVEGLAFSLRANAENLADGTVARLALTGGLARSAFWTQLVSDVLGVPVTVPSTTESSALGAAICAGAGAGLFRDLAEGAAKLSRMARTHSPGETSARVYQPLYAHWQRMREAAGPSEEIAAEMLLQHLAANGDADEAPTPSFRPRILVTAQFDDAGVDGLRRLGEVEHASYREAMRVLTDDDLVETLRGVQVFVTEVDVIDREALKRLPDLRVVVSCRGHAVNVDTAACTALGIPVLHAPGRNADAVADLTVGFMLMLARHLPRATSFLREPGIEAGDMGRMGQAHAEFLGHELWGKTVGLVGLGAVGRAVAARVARFGARVIVYDPGIPTEEAELADAESVSLETLLAGSDFVSLHAAVTGSTRGMIGAPQLSAMKRTAFLVNTARAALVDEDALTRAVRDGQIAGAALDVFSAEPPGADHPLLALPNVIATPHVGGNTREVAAHQGRLVVEDLRRLLANQRPRHVLNPETLDRFAWQGERRAPSGTDGTRPVVHAAPAVSDLQQAQPRPAPKRVAETGGNGKAATPAVTGAASRFEQIARAFVENARADRALIEFSHKRKVMTHYTISDIGLELHVGFDRGRVFGDLGAPPEPAPVRMKMSAETFDGVLSGRLNGMKAAMSGKLAFSGDVRVAMSLQRVQSDLVRLYRAARAQVGDPGDLSALGKPAAGVRSVVPAMDGDPRTDLVRAARELYAQGLFTATGGNLSVRIEGRDEAWITPSQLFKGDLAESVMVRIDLEGHGLDAGALAPSSERLVHTEIFKARPDCRAVIHAHAPQATTLALSGIAFQPISTEAAFLGEIPVVPFVMPGTRELALEVVRHMGRRPAVLLQNHGVVVAAGDMRRALNVMEVIERTSQLILGCHAVGCKPPRLPRSVLKELEQIGDMMA